MVLKAFLIKEHQRTEEFSAKILQSIKLFYFAEQSFNLRIYKKNATITFFSREMPEETSKSFAEHNCRSTGLYMTYIVWPGFKKALAELYPLFFLAPM